MKNYCPHLTIVLTALTIGSTIPSRIISASFFYICQPSILVVVLGNLYNSSMEEVCWMIIETHKYLQAAKQENQHNPKHHRLLSFVAGFLQHGFAS